MPMSHAASPSETGPIEPSAKPPYSGVFSVFFR